MAFTLCASNAAVNKAGANANSTIIASNVALTLWSDDAEGAIISDTRRDWVTHHSGLSTGIKSILSEACSSLIAMKIINYDMGGYNSILEATTMLDVLKDDYNRIITDLKDFKSTDIKAP